MHGKAKKGGKPKSLSTDVFAGRVIRSDEILNAVVSTVVGPGGEETLSSYPHLTKGTDARDAHITSSRVVAVTPGFVIHQRFHQNDDGRSEPTHDRYFSVNAATGEVLAASAKFTPDVHLGKKDALPMRGTTLAEAGRVHPKMTFTVGAVDDKHPPLSPRSTTRTVPDKGY